MASFAQRLVLDDDDDDDNEEEGEEDQEDQDQNDQAFPVADADADADAVSDADALPASVDTASSFGWAPLEDGRLPATLGEYVHVLSGDLLDRVCGFLDEDSLDFCKCCNRAWYEALQSERLWRAFCMRTFVPPAFRPVRCCAGPGHASRAGKPKRFGTWQVARKRRPRVRMETGIYMLQSMYVQSCGSRSMWSPEDYKPVMEIRHYRYLVFKPDGQVLYASTPLPMSKMRQKFARRLREEYLARGALLAADDGPGPEDGNGLGHAAKGNSNRGRGRGRDKGKRLSARQRANLVDPTKADAIFPGFYTVVGSRASVVLDMGRYTVTFELELLDNDGAHDVLRTERHQSVYHKVGEAVTDYELSLSIFDRTWHYYNFDQYHDVLR